MSWVVIKESEVFERAVNTAAIFSINKDVDGRNKTIYFHDGSSEPYGMTFETEGRAQEVWEKLTAEMKRI